jgi:hypothetical protein
VKVRTVTVFFWVFLIAAAAVASEGRETRIEIAVASEGDDAEIFEWHSADSGIDLSHLEVGQSETITNEDGRDVTVTRTEDGFDIAIDGENIDVMKIHGDGEHGDVMIKKTKNIKIIKAGEDAGVTIISSDTIDEKTRQRLTEVLNEAGKDGEILFLDGSELSGAETAHGRHEVHVIKKEIDATN